MRFRNLYASLTAILHIDIYTYYAPHYAIRILLTFTVLRGVERNNCRVSLARNISSSNVIQLEMPAGISI